MIPPGAIAHILSISEEVATLGDLEKTVTSGFSKQTVLRVVTRVINTRELRFFAVECFLRLPGREEKGAIWRPERADRKTSVCTRLRGVHLG